MGCMLGVGIGKPSLGALSVHRSRYSEGASAAGLGAVQEIDLILNWIKLFAPNALLLRDSLSRCNR